MDFSNKNQFSIFNKYIEITKVCYEANRACHESSGDYSYKKWNDISDSEKNQFFNIIIYFIKNNNYSSTIKNIHNTWVKNLVLDGWTYGPIRDVKNKKDPIIVELKDLPQAIKTKYYIIRSIVVTMTDNIW